MEIFPVVSTLIVFVLPYPVNIILLVVAVVPVPTLKKVVVDDPDAKVIFAGRLFRSRM